MLHAHRVRVKQKPNIRVVLIIITIITGSVCVISIGHGHAPGLKLCDRFSYNNYYGLVMKTAKPWYDITVQQAIYLYLTLLGHNLLTTRCRQTEANNSMQT